jgi:hypothetical protein
MLGYETPCLHLVARQLEALAQNGSGSRIMLLQPGQGSDALVDVPACQDIRVGVVVNALVVLVRTDNNADVKTTVLFVARRARGKATRRLEKNIEYNLKH